MSSKTSLVEVALSTWRLIKETWRAPFCQNAVTLGIMGGIAPYLVHRGTLGALSIGHTLNLV